VRRSEDIVGTDGDPESGAPGNSAAPAAEWSRYPSVYEINTWVWLYELSKKYGKDIDLSNVPQPEWDALALGFDAIWLMGVWERSPAGIETSNNNAILSREFRSVLSDFSLADNVGSAYCVRNYEVDQHLGGPDGLAVARRELRRRGMKLILDFVPNHVAPDHPWTIEHPEYFIQGNDADAAQNPSAFIRVGKQVFACGRDPYSAPWRDVLQLNAFHPDVRNVAIQTITAIAQQCDGVRCDMAMLLLNDVFERTWGQRAGQRPSTEYWVEVISAVKVRQPQFLFIAEAYWDLEWTLQQQGFDFCYDKKLYDRLEHGDAEGIWLHLCADRQYQDRLVRFIENHDEPRAAATFSVPKEKAAAVTMSTVSGMKLFHEGQIEGRKIKVPVFLDRRPDEQPDAEITTFYAKLLKAIDRSVFRAGDWHLCDRFGWPDNRSFENVVGWTWNGQDERYLIIVNLSDSPSQAMVKVNWPDVIGHHWHLEDPIAEIDYVRDGQALAQGLYIDRPAWGFHFFRCTRSAG
jgi:glycosidase